MADFSAVADGQQGQASWATNEYFQQYITDEVFESTAMAMNTKHVAETGKSLHTSVEEVKVFFEIWDSMFYLGYPQIRMYWQNSMRVPFIANRMSRNRYFQLQSQLKVAGRGTSNLFQWAGSGLPDLCPET